MQRDIQTDIEWHPHWEKHLLVYFSFRRLLWSPRSPRS